MMDASAQDEIKLDRDHLANQLKKVKDAGVKSGGIQSTGPRYVDPGFRIECLRIAKGLGTYGTSDADKIIENAKKFADFVEGRNEVQ